MVDILSLVLLHKEEDELRAVELALEAGVPTKTHILNLLYRLIDRKQTDHPQVAPPDALVLHATPEANIDRNDGLRRAAEQRVAPKGAHIMKRGRHDLAGASIVIMLRSLNLKGIANAVEDLVAQGAPAFEAATPLLSQLLKAEIAEREGRSDALHISGKFKREVQHRRRMLKS